MLLLLALACTDADKHPPASLHQMSLRLLQDFDLPEAEEQAREMAAWLDGQIDEAPDGWYLENLAQTDVSDYEHSPNADWAEVLGAGVPALVGGTTAAYAQASTEADQSFADPRTYIKWSRDITAGSRDGFLSDREPMSTWNQIEKSGPFGIVIPYGMYKDFRWVNDMFIARSVVPEEGWADDGENGIIVGFTIEIWFDRGDAVVWYNASWTEIATIIGDAFPLDAQLKAFIDGTHDYFEGTEAHVLGED